MVNDKTLGKHCNFLNKYVPIRTKYLSHGPAIISCVEGQPTYAAVLLLVLFEILSVAVRLVLRIRFKPCEVPDGPDAGGRRCAASHAGIR